MPARQRAFLEMTMAARYGVRGQRLLVRCGLRSLWLLPAKRDSRSCECVDERIVELLVDHIVDRIRVAADVGQHLPPELPSRLVDPPLVLEPVDFGLIFHVNENRSHIFIIPCR